MLDFKSLYFMLTYSNQILKSRLNWLLSLNSLKRGGECFFMLLPSEACADNLLCLCALRTVTGLRLRFCCTHVGLNFCTTHSLFLSVLTLSKVWRLVSVVTLTWRARKLSQVWSDIRAIDTLSHSRCYLADLRHTRKISIKIASLSLYSRWETSVFLL